MEAENVLSRLTETLKFYAEEANYVNDQINKDRGFQARFALEQVKQIQAAMDKFEKSYDDYVRETQKASSPEEIKKLIDDISKLR